MSNFRLKTIQENGQYIGCLLEGNQVVFKTAPQSTPNMASILLTKYLNEQANTIRVNRTNSPASASSTNVIVSVSQSAPATSSHMSPPRRCCGRG